MGLAQPMPCLIWNATASTPVGLYLLRPDHAFKAMDLVAVLPPEPVAKFLADGGFLPKGVLLLKHILALPGQTVCRSGHLITVDNVSVGEARDCDHLDRPLPIWSGCRTLQEDEIFLMNPTVSESLDGRYFGLLPAHAILGRAIPLLTDEAGDGHFAWRASAS
jgi:conjugative transfer signal peptidase TraF